MILFRTLMACGLTASLLLPCSTAEAGKGKKKKAGQPVRGTVTTLQASETDKDSGTFSVKAHVRKKKAATASSEAAEKKFTFTKDTKVVSRTGKKKDRTETAASIADVTSGSRVIVTADANGKAEKVMVLAGKKGKKKKQG